VFLNVTVDDPQGLLPPAQAVSVQSAQLRVGLFYANGAYVGLEDKFSAGTHNYQAAIPVGAPMDLWLFSKDFTLADADGNPVSPSAGYRVHFQAAASQSQKFTFALAGSAPAAAAADARRN
jgi:hypothetical protein